MARRYCFSRHGIVQEILEDSKELVLGIVGRYGLREAAPYVAPLVERKDFWNRKVRQAAERLMESWHLEAWREG